MVHPKTHVSIGLLGATVLESLIDNKFLPIRLPNMWLKTILSF